MEGGAGLMDLPEHKASADIAASESPEMTKASNILLKRGIDKSQKMYEQELRIWLLQA